MRLATWAVSLHGQAARGPVRPATVRDGTLRVPLLLFAVPLIWDLLLSAKHLFVDAMRSRESKGCELQLA
jgi:hypothetical protein